MTGRDDKTRSAVERFEDRLSDLERIDAAIRARSPSARHNLDTVRRLQAELERGSRDAFIEALAGYVDTQPSLGALKAMAEDDPLKHMQGMKIAAGLAGVAERHEISGPERLSDSELIDTLIEQGWTPPARAFPHELDLEAEPTAERGPETSERGPEMREKRGSEAPRLEPAAKPTAKPQEEEDDPPDT